MEVNLDEFDRLDSEDFYVRTFELADYSEQTTWIKNVVELKSAVGSNVVDLSRGEMNQLGFVGPDLKMSVYGVAKVGTYGNNKWYFYFEDSEYLDFEGQRGSPFLTVSADRLGKPLSAYVCVTQSVAIYLLDKYRNNSFLSFVKSCIEERNKEFHYDPETAKMILVERAHLYGELEQLKPETTRIREIRSSIPMDEVTTVAQNTFSVAGPGLGKRYIETGPVGPCIIVTLYDLKTHRAAMAHFQAGSDVKSAMLEMSSRVGGNSYEIRIVGGQAGESELLLKKIADEVGKYGKVVEKDVLGEDGHLVVLDTIDGDLYDLKQPKRRTDKLFLKAQDLMAISMGSFVVFQEP